VSITIKVAGFQGGAGDVTRFCQEVLGRFVGATVTGEEITLYGVSQEDVDRIDRQALIAKWHEWTAERQVQETQRERDEVAAEQAKIDFRNLPGWSTWTPDEAAAAVREAVLNGMDVATLDAWVDANVTNLAEAKDALKLIGEQVIALRTATETLAKAVEMLRIISVRSI